MNMKMEDMVCLQEQYKVVCEHHESFPEWVSTMTVGQMLEVLKTNKMQRPYLQAEAFIKSCVDAGYLPAPATQSPAM